MNQNVAGYIVATGLRFVCRASPEIGSGPPSANALARTASSSTTTRNFSACRMSRGVHSSRLGPALANLLLQSVLNSLSSPKTQETYRTAILDFLGWFRRFAKPSLGSSLEAWRTSMVRRGLAPSSVNQRLSAVRLFFRHAQKHGAIRADETLDLLEVRNVRLPLHSGRPGLTADEAGQLLMIPNGQTLLGKRDRAMLALLIACGIQQKELVHLALDHLQQREGRWVLLILAGRKRRAVPVLPWVKELLECWLQAANITNGFLFRRVRKNGELDREETPLSDDVVYTMVKRAAAAIGRPGLTPRDLRQNSFTTVPPKRRLT